MPLLSTFAGAALRTYGRGTQQLPATIPAGAVMFFDVANTQATLPANCAYYAEANGRYIIGTNINSEVGQDGASSGTSLMTFTSTTNGDHTSSMASSMKYSYFNQGINERIRGVLTNGDDGSNTVAGAHVHSSVTFDTLGALSNTCSVAMITASAQLPKIPPKAVVFRKIRPANASFSDYRPSGNGHYYGANTAGWQNNTGATQGAGTTNSTGSHYHGVYNDYLYRYATSGTKGYLPVDGGDHNHSAVVGGLVATLRSKHLKAWVSVQETEVEYGMIVMFSGSISRLPPGWRLCDGTLGTPDMVNYFIGYTSTEAHDEVISSQTEVVSANSCVLATATSAHTHQFDNTPSLTGLATHPGYHAGYVWSHNHSVSSINSSVTTVTPYMPMHKKLAFIQYKGI